jgi:hypothetical protein
MASDSAHQFCFDNSFLLFTIGSDNDTTADNPMVAKYQEELDPEDQVSNGSLDELAARPTVADIIRESSDDNDIEKTLTETPVANHKANRSMFSTNTIDGDDISAAVDNHYNTRPSVSVSRNASLSTPTSSTLTTTATPTSADTSEMGSESGSATTKTGRKTHTKTKTKTKKKSKTKRKGADDEDDEQRRLEEFLGPDVSREVTAYEEL